MSLFIQKYDYSPNISGFKQYLRDWNQKIKPEYLMASLSYDFFYERDHHNYSQMSEKDLSPSQEIDLIIVLIALE